MYPNKLDARQPPKPEQPPPSPVDVGVHAPQLHGKVSVGPHQCLCDIDVREFGDHLPFFSAGQQPSRCWKLRHADCEGVVASKRVGTRLPRWKAAVWTGRGMSRVGGEIAE